MERSKVAFFYFFLNGSRHVHATAHVWKSFQKLVFSYCVGSTAETHDIMLGSKWLYLLSHLRAFIWFQTKPHVSQADF